MAIHCWFSQAWLLVRDSGHRFLALFYWLSFKLVRALVPTCATYALSCSHLDNSVGGLVSHAPLSFFIATIAARLFLRRHVADQFLRVVWLNGERAATRQRRLVSN